MRVAVVITADGPVEERRAHSHKSVLPCRWAAAYYDQQRQKGASHPTALRALGFKWRRIILRGWQDRTTCDDTRYEKSLKARRSPIAALLKRVEVGKNPAKSHAE